MTITAKIIADSIANGIRLTTLELEYPRFIHSEFMTHRMFSRNASSSRAIPVQKMIDAVESNPAMPIHWGKNQSGMQAGEECNSEINTELLFDESEQYRYLISREVAWRFVSRKTINAAKAFSNADYHKQIVNRLLEPFSHIKVIVTATEWDNFFKLRLHPDAQPEIQELARVMKEAMDNSVPVELPPGQWHLPYVNYAEFWWDSRYASPEAAYVEAIKCSVARCARVSYLNHDKSNPDIEKDIKLADQLLAAGHMSPFEHIATPMNITKGCSDGGLYLQFDDLNVGTTHVDVKSGDCWSGNFRGWIQYRALLNAE